MKPVYLLLFIPILLGINSCSEKSVAQSTTEETLTFTGDFPNPFSISMDDLKTMPVQTVPGKDKDEETYEFQGVWLRDLVEKAGVEFGTGLKGKKQAQYILLEGKDGYKVVFSLPELDPEFSGKQILLAYARDGQPLEEGVGPLRIIVPEEKLHARWIRELVAVKLIKID